MSELLDKLEKASRGSVQQLGFGATKRENVAPMLLLGAVDAGNDSQAKLVKDAGLDAAIVKGLKPAKKDDIDKSSKTLSKVTFGVWQDEAQAKDPAGSDFQVFSAESTPIGSLSGEKRTIVMQVVPELNDSLLRTIDQLPVDAFLVSLADAESLTVAQLMRLARVRGVTSNWILAHLVSLPSQEELEQLHDIGVGGIIVDMAGKTAAALKACLKAMSELSHEQPARRKGHAVATLPSVSVPGAPSRPAPEPEPDDDDDWDDE